MPAAELRAAAAAFAFLTRLPVGRAVTIDGGDLARSAPSFPLVGAALGAAVGATAIALVDLLSPGLAAAVALSLAALLTGAMHLDALADTADALGASSRDRALEVMRDPRIGAFGTAALVLVLIAQASALATIAAAGDVAVVAACFALSRATAAPLAAALPDARRGEGLGGPLATGGLVRAGAGAAIAAGLAVVLCGATGAALTGTAAGCALLAGMASRRRFGGVTGDTLGATIAVAETVCLCAAVACAHGSAA